MSSNIYWRPIVPIEGHRLPFALKSVLRKKFGYPIQGVLQASDLGYIEGLKDAGIEGAEQLIEAVEKHQMIEVSED